MMSSMNAIKNSYPNGECPDCAETIPDTVQHGEECHNCGHVFVEEKEPDDSMDGDHETGLASAGFGTDEDYGGDCEHI